MAQAQLPSFQTYSQIAEHFGVSRATVAYYLALLTRLPSSFVTWLRDCNDPGILSYFTERRLRPLTRIDDATEQAARLRQMMEDSQSRAFLEPQSPRASEEGSRRHE